MFLLEAEGKCPHLPINLENDTNLSCPQWLEECLGRQTSTGKGIDTWHQALICTEHFIPIYLINLVYLQDTIASLAKIQDSDTWLRHEGQKSVPEFYFGF